jgi:hypothetical protein
VLLDPQAVLGKSPSGEHGQLGLGLLAAHPLDTAFARPAPLGSQ